MTKSQEEQLGRALDILTKLDGNVTTLMSEVKALQANQQSTESAISVLSNKLSLVENEISSIREAQSGLLEKLQSELEEVRQQNSATAANVSSITTRLNDLEDRSRRDNVVFYGITDSANETWTESESKVVDLCANKLGIQCTSADFDRVHRIGKFSVDKPRPIIAKFCSFKLKESVISSGHQLKGSGLSVANDFSSATRLARRRLIEFAKGQNANFKLRHDKLFIGPKSYHFDASADCVRECRQ